MPISSHPSIYIVVSLSSTLYTCIYASSFRPIITDPYIHSLTHLYRLRALAAEHAGSLIKSLDSHGASDNTVQVFHKIFRNELEEDFRFIHAELSKTIKDLTMVQMMSRSNNSKDAEGMQAKVGDG